MVVLGGGWGSCSTILTKFSVCHLFSPQEKQEHNATSARPM